MNQIFKQNKKKHNRYIVLTALTIIIAIILIAVYETSLGKSIKKEDVNNQAESLTKIEETLTPAKLNLTSTQNGREIKLTKFIATKKKFVFNYQFKLDDNRLKQLLDKELAVGSNQQDILFSLFSSNDMSNNFVAGGIVLSTFRIEGDTFYGTVTFTFNSNKMPDETNLILQISELSWEDRDDRQAAEARASETGAPFSVPTALKYEGNWQFNITYQPLIPTSKPRIMQVVNIKDIKANSDVLQTTVKFKAPFNKENSPSVDIYKDNVKVNSTSFEYEPQDEMAQFKLSFDMSALDKTSVYKIQVSSVDKAGKQVAELGSFSMQNKSS